MLALEVTALLLRTLAPIPLVLAYVCQGIFPYAFSSLLSIVMPVGLLRLSFRLTTATFNMWRAVVRSLAVRFGFISHCHRIKLVLRVFFLSCFKFLELYYRALLLLHFLLFVPHHLCGVIASWIAVRSLFGRGGAA